mmetsp:Transcript_7184/g.12868  ORF Transcript_7184/g.12868 Transcript_7184/m.12868 type:complete len:1443 (-) Transcript_7184:109-4437(-)
MSFASRTPVPDRDGVSPYGVSPSSDVALALQRSDHMSLPHGSLQGSYMPPGTMPSYGASALVTGTGGGASGSRDMGGWSEHRRHVDEYAKFGMASGRGRRAGADREMLARQLFAATFEGLKPGPERIMGAYQAKQATTLAVFRVTGSYEYEKPSHLGDAEYTPGAEFVMTMEDTPMDIRDRVRSLTPRAAVRVQYEHNYVDIGGSKHPVRVVTQLHILGTAQREVMARQTFSAVFEGTRMGPEPATRAYPSRLPTTFAVFRVTESHEYVKHSIQGDKEHLPGSEFLFVLDEVDAEIRERIRTLMPGSAVRIAYEQSYVDSGSGRFPERSIAQLSVTSAPGTALQRRPATDYAEQGAYAGTREPSVGLNGRSRAVSADRVVTAGNSPRFSSAAAGYPSSFADRLAVEAYQGSSLGMSPALHRRTPFTSTEAETFLFAVVKMRRMVSQFHQHLQAITESRVAYDPTVQQLRELADALDVEVRSASACAGGADISGAGGSPALLGAGGAAAGASSPGRGSYDMLRQSLQEEQRRCKNLNGEMLKLQQTNEELMGALNATKDANKRLNDQVRQLSDDVAAHERRAVGDEERLEDFKRRSRLEDDMREKEVQRRIASLEDGAQLKCQKVQQAYSCKLRMMHVHLDKLHKELSRLRTDHAEHRRATVSFRESAKQQLQQAEWALAQRVEAFTKRQLELRVATADTARDLEVRIAAEREMRMNEVSSWSHRHALLSAERDDLQARLTRDVGHLAAQCQANERTLEEERRRWSEEQTEAQRQREDLTERCRSCESALEQTKSELMRYESGNAALEQERRDNQARLEAMQRQLREADDALAATVAGNETLRREMEEQRQRLTDQGDKAVASCKDSYEQRLVRIADEHRLSMSQSHEKHTLTNERAILAEERLRTAEMEIERSQHQASTAASDMAALRADLVQARSEIQETLNTQRQLESELAQARHEHREERAGMQASGEKLAQRKVELEGDAQQLQERLQDLHRASAERDAQHSKISGALEAGIRDREARIEDRERRLAEANQATAEAAAEVTMLKQQVTDMQATIDHMARESTDERRRFEDDRRRLEEAVTSQTRTSQENHEQYERWREEHMATFRHTQDEGAVRIAALEQEREMCRGELSETKQKLAEAVAKHEATEQDLGRVRHLLTEVQSGADRVKHEREHEAREGDSKRQQLEEELRRVSSALESAIRNEEALTRQLEQASVKHHQDRTRLDRELEEMRASGQQQILEREKRSEWLKAEYEKRIQSIESHHKAELEREKARVDSVLHQNEQLRRFFAEHKKSSTAGMSSLQSQLESHILRLQQHTSELRGDLDRSTTVASPGGFESPSARSASQRVSGGVTAATGPAGMDLPNLGTPMIAPMETGLRNRDASRERGGVANSATSLAGGGAMPTEFLSRLEAGGSGFGGTSWREQSPSYMTPGAGR